MHLSCHLFPAANIYSWHKQIYWILLGCMYYICPCERLLSQTTCWRIPFFRGGGGGALGEIMIWYDIASLNPVDRPQLHKVVNNIEGRKDIDTIIHLCPKA